MIIEILQIRLSQLYRLFKGIGLFRIITLLLLLVLVSYLTFNFLTPEKNTCKSLIVIGLLLVSVHSTRKDKDFLRAICKSHYPIFLSEYLLLVLPFLVIWITFSNWIGAGVLVFMVLLIPSTSINFSVQYLKSIFQLLINPFTSNVNSKFKISLPFVSTISFEWISGIRRNLLILAPVYLLIIAFAFKPYVAVIGLIFLSILVSGFYFFGESREFIELLARSPKELLKIKIVTTLKQLFIVFIPILIIAFIFQPSTWYYLLGALFISFIIQILTIIFKYGLFEENSNLNQNSLIVFLNILFVLVPIFWPAPIILGIRYYIKAHKNLNRYYHDCD